MPERYRSSSAAFGSSSTRRTRHSCPTGGNGERDVELRVVLLDVRRAVLGAEAFDDGADLGAGGDRSRPSRPPAPFGAQGDGRMLERVLVPLRVRARHGQEIDRAALEGKPDGTGAFATGAPPDHSELDLLHVR